MWFSMCVLSGRQESEFLGTESSITFGYSLLLSLSIVICIIFKHSFGCQWVDYWKKSFWISFLYESMQYRTWHAHLHQPLQYPDEYDATVVHARSRRDEHVENCGENDSCPEHPDKHKHTITFIQLQGNICNKTTQKIENRICCLCAYNKMQCRVCLYYISIDIYFYIKKYEISM